MIRTSILLLACAILVLAHDHEHSHGSEEPPHFKYSQEANKGHGHSHTGHKSMRSDPSQQLLLETAGAVALISLAPFLLLFLIPDLSKYNCLLRLLLAFAAGGLLGDAFLHLIPHALDHGHTHGGHDHSRHMMVGLSVVSGIFLFLCIEKVVRLVRPSGHGHSHAGAHPPTSNADSKGKGKSTKKNAAGGASDDSKKVAKSGKTPEFRVAGYLNLAADFTHNFTDGMAIGASFLVSRNAGIMTTMTVLFHELPHEIGDYAILIQSGCSARKAMCLQLLTAFGAAIGAGLSLLAAGVGSEFIHLDIPILFTEDLLTGCVLPFTAGGFIYIALTSVLPDLLSADETTSGGGKKPATGGCFRRVVQSMAEVVTLVGGIGMMALLSTLE